MAYRLGIVDVGGGLRAIYGAGVLDRCMDGGLRFDLGIGVSAGSANLASYAAGQPRRNLRFYTIYSRRRETMGLWNFLHRRSYIDLDYVYSVLSNSDGEAPLDYRALRQNPIDLLTVATEAATGRARYFEKRDVAQDCYHIFKASSAIPFVCRPYCIGGTAYFDGAVSDPVPVAKAFSLGCERVVLVLTRPRGRRLAPEEDLWAADLIRRDYPLVARRLEQRAARYNEGLRLAEDCERQGRLLIVAPQDTCGVGTLCRDVDALRRLYDRGYRDGAEVLRFAAAGQGGERGRKKEDALPEQHVFRRHDWSAAQLRTT
ncbi:MAG: patatin family protein [Clostridia bacterium]|nr:patatin family protein [Clostridia bacterium]